MIEISNIKFKKNAFFEHIMTCWPIVRIESLMNVCSKENDAPNSVWCSQRTLKVLHQKGKKGKFTYGFKPTNTTYSVTLLYKKNAFLSAESYATDLISTV